MVLLLAFALAGCANTGSTTTSASTSQRAINHTFDDTLGVLPAGWTLQNGQWSVVTNATARSGNYVLKGVGAPEPGFSAVLAPGSWDELDLTLDFVMVSGGGGQIGDVPQGAGAIIHRSSEKDFQVIRYSASEKSWNLFTVVTGTRNKQPSATLAGGTNPVFGQWVHMSVSSKAGLVTVKDGSTPVLSYQLPDGHSRTGMVGPFVRGDTIAYFDDVNIH
jgi:hypothetical protein